MLRDLFVVDAKHHDVISHASIRSYQYILNYIYHEIKTYCRDNNKKKTSGNFFYGMEYRTLLEWAVICNQSNDEIKLHIEQQSDRGFSRKNIMHYAAIYGRSKAARILVDNGADVHGRNAYDEIGHDRLPLQYACEYGHVDFAKNILSIFSSIYPNDAKLIKHTLMDVLMLACENNHHEIVLAIVKISAHLGVGFSNYLDAIETAAKLGHQKVVEVLLRHRPYQVTGKKLLFALQNAIRSDHFAIAELLFNNGAVIVKKFIPDIGSIFYLTAIDIAYSKKNCDEAFLKKLLCRQLEEYLDYRNLQPLYTNKLFTDWGIDAGYDRSQKTQAVSRMIAILRSETKTNSISKSEYDILNQGKTGDMISRAGGILRFVTVRPEGTEEDVEDLSLKNRSAG